MQFNTKLNVNDTVWTFPQDTTALKFQCHTIMGITVKLFNGELPTIRYTLRNNTIIYEHKEGKQWWRTEKDAINKLYGTFGKPNQCTCGHCEDKNNPEAPDLKAQYTANKKVNSLSEEYTRFFQDPGEVNENPKIDKKYFEEPKTPIKNQTTTAETLYAALNAALEKMFPQPSNDKPQPIAKSELENAFNEIFHHPDEELDDDFDRNFGEYVCSNPKPKNQNELNALYEELYNRSETFKIGDKVKLQSNGCPDKIGKLVKFDKNEYHGRKYKFMDNYGEITYCTHGLSKL
jgi:hypothetical protein